ncbi:MAG: peptidoglycan editing factor PgeF [Parachlamydiaceae bacterium]
MKLRQQGPFLFWHFDLLIPFKNLRHGCFLKHDRLNLDLFQETFQLPTASLTQIHGDHIIKAKKSGVIGEGDALITKQKNLALTIRHADCQAALMYDPTQHVAAAIHCGWRGSVHGIYTKTIQELQKSFGSRPQNLLVCISPSLGPQAAQFINYQAELPSSFSPYQIKPLHFDFWKISEDELLGSGILKKHIEIARQCTYASPNKYHSYRYNKTQKRLLSFIALL